jgi:DNA-binding transcriptional ArsR family regulator
MTTPSSGEAASAPETPPIHPDAGPNLDFGGPQPVADITTVLQALGDPVRLTIVRTLADDEDLMRTCGSFVADLGLTKSTLSHHFRVLRESGLIEQHYEGTRKLSTLRRKEVEAVYPGLLDSVLRGAATLAR